MGIDVSKHIVILGGGFAGIAVARELERRMTPGEITITLISRENFSLFTPMLPEVSSGALDTRHVVTPVRSQLRATAFILAEITAVNLAERTVEFVHTLRGDADRITFDHVVFALGSVTSTFNLPGVAQRVFALKTLEDAGILRNRFMYLLELADTAKTEEERRALLTVVIVGGGFTGVEAAGEIVELFPDVAHLFPNVSRDDVRVVLVEGGTELLPGLPPKMGTYSAKDLGRRGVELFLGDGVAKADDDGLELNSGTRIKTKTIVWSAGVRPSPLAQQLPLPQRKRAIAVNPDFSISGFPGVWALGDCASIPDDAGGTYPPTAQHAIREGPVLARNLLAVLRSQRTVPFRYTSLGMMASLGSRKAVAQLPGDRVLTGFLAWFLWRSYYLSRLPGLDRKLRVAFDWTLELLFARDISEIRVYSSRAQSSAAIDAGLAPREDGNAVAISNP